MEYECKTDHDYRCGSLSWQYQRHAIADESAVMLFGIFMQLLKLCGGADLKKIGLGYGNIGKKNRNKWIRITNYY